MKSKRQKQPTQVLIKHKEHQPVHEFAEMLEKIAQKLKDNGKFTFVQGTEQIEITPAERVKAEYEYKVKGDKHEFEIEFEWRTGDRAAQSMTIK